MSTVSEVDRKNELNPEEMERWRNDDLHASRIVVGLMTGVFVAGLLLYSIILFVVLAG